MPATQRDLGTSSSRPASVRSVPSSPPPKAGASLEHEKRFGHDQINEVTKHEQNQCVATLRRPNVVAGLRERTS